MKKILLILMFLFSTVAAFSQILFTVENISAIEKQIFRGVGQSILCLENTSIYVVTETPSGAANGSTIIQILGTTKFAEVEVDLSTGGGGTDDQTAAEVPFTPTGNILSNDVQSMGEELQTQIDAIQSAFGISNGAQNLGAFPLSTISDNQDLKSALIELEAAVESAGGVSTQVADLTALAASSFPVGTLVTLQNPVGAIYKIESTVPSGWNANTADGLIVVADANSKFGVLQTREDGNYHTKDLGLTTGAATISQTQENRRKILTLIDFAVRTGTCVGFNDLYEVYNDKNANRTYQDLDNFCLIGLKQGAGIDWKPEHLNFSESNDNSTNRMDVFTLDGASHPVRVENMTIHGMKYEILFQTYNATFSDASTIVLENEPVWTNFWSTLSVGDTIWYDSDITRNNNLSGAEVTVAGFDQGTRTITINETISATHLGYAVDPENTHIGFLWPEDDLTISDVDYETYGKNWDLSNNFNSTFIFTTFDEGEAVDNFKVTDSKILHFQTGISRSGNVGVTVLDNVEMDNHSVSLSLFDATTSDPTEIPLIIQNSYIHDTGVEITGGTLDNSQDGFLGGNIYLHPNVSYRGYNTIFESNVANLRNFSGSGVNDKLPPSGSFCLLEGCVFKNNITYDVLTSGAMDTKIVNCIFENSAGINTNAGLQISGSSLTDTEISAVQNNDLNDANAKAKGIFRMLFDKVEFIGNSIVNVNGFADTQIDRSEWLFTNCNWNISKNTTLGKINLNNNGDSGTNIRLVDCTYTINEDIEKVSWVANIDGDDIGGFFTGSRFPDSIYVSNLQRTGRTTGTYTLNIPFIDYPNENGYIEIVNSDIEAWGPMTATTRSFGGINGIFQDISLTNVRPYFGGEFTWTKPKEQSTVIRGYRMAGNNAAPLTIDNEYENSVVIDQDALLVNTSGNTLRNVIIKGFNVNHPSGPNDGRFYQASLHGRNATTRTIIPTEDITVELWDKNQQWLGNIASTEDATLRKGIKYDLVPNPYFPVGQATDFYTDVSVDLFTVTGGDQTYEDVSAPSFYTHDGKSRCAYVPGSLKLVGSVASTFEYQVGRNGRIGSGNNIKGYVLSHFKGYYLDLTNLNIPDNTVISLQGDLQCECTNMGTYDIFKKNKSLSNISGLPTYADDSAAGTGGLSTGDVYQTSTGELRIKL